VNTLQPRSSFCFRTLKTPVEETDNSLTKIISKNELLNRSGIYITVIIKSKVSLQWVCVDQERVMASGDSRMKKWGSHCGGKEKLGGQHKYLPCMVIFNCFEDEVAMINLIKPKIGL